MELLDVVRKLLGPIDPVGETQMDERRFENLQATIKLVEDLMEDIDDVGYLHRESHEFSVKRSAEFASKWQAKVLKE